MAHSPVAELKKDLRKRIKLYEQRRRVCRAWALGVRTCMIACSALTTVLLGLRGFNPEWHNGLADAALCLSAVVSGLSS
jgi:hypothetical protein